MIDSKNLGEYFGFTVKEVQSLSQQYDIPYSEIERWYDGYLLDELHIYNPKSVVDVLLWKEFQSYWTGTETYEALKFYIDMNFDGLKESIIEMLGNSHCKINTRKFQNDMTTFRTKDDILTLLIHLGYLGYLAYDKKDSTSFIPNLEITQEFLNVVDEPGWEGLTQALNRSEELLKSTWSLDSQAVADGVAAIHNETASMLKYNNENSLTCTVLMAYYSAKTYYLPPELSGKSKTDNMLPGSGSIPEIFFW